MKWNPATLQVYAAQQIQRSSLQAVGPFGAIIVDKTLIVRPLANIVKTKTIVFHMSTAEHAKGMSGKKWDDVGQALYVECKEGRLDPNLSILEIQ